MKNSQKLYNSITEIDDKYIEEALNYKAVKKLSIWYKIGTVAACLVIAGTAIFAFGNTAKPQNDISTGILGQTTLSDTQTASEKQNGTEPASQQSDLRRFKLISSFNGSSETACYKSPDDGECFLSIPLRGAIEKYKDEFEGESVVYKTTLSIFSGGESLEINRDKVDSEIKRLNALGYKTEISKETDGSQIIVYATYKQLMQFEKKDGFGYFFFLYDEWEH